MFKLNASNKLLTNIVVLYASASISSTNNNSIDDCGGAQLRFTSLIESVITFSNSFALPERNFMNILNSSLFLNIKYEGGCSKFTFAFVGLKVNPYK